MGDLKLEEIKFSNVFCNQVAHQGEFIKTLCLNPDCQENCTLCSKCLINSHLQCRSQVKELEVIPGQLLDLLKHQLGVVTFQEKINQAFKELLNQTQEIVLPISKYQDSPNFTNLNGIGFLLRKLPNQTFIRCIEQTKIKIRQLLDDHQFYHEQLNYNIQLDKGGALSDQLQLSKTTDLQVKTPVIITQKVSILQEKCIDQQLIQNDEANINNTNSSTYWYWKGIALHWQNKYNEAIDCYDQAVKINPNHSGCWYQKGLALLLLGKYDEAINYYDKAIQINPKDKYYWNNKGQTLSKLGKLLQSVKYYEEAIKIDPNYIKAQDNLKKAQQTLNIIQ